ncbi:general substrate transporter [Calocera viscosa TUFC12733]|uniref:General substrate transporter n=1 Tax=Calocera viscosa (strain TUFC12733) TaxID=1330018 RepID=A0A167I6V6_CALVF|nr:general substrate transporter [Calocera viscosa TUFC12733]
MSYTPEEKEKTGLGDVEHLEHVAPVAGPSGHHAHKTLVAVDERLAGALAVDRPNPWGRGYLRLYLASFIVFFCSTMTGYDGALLSSINALPNYTAYYGLPASGNTSTGIVFAIFNVGTMVGSFMMILADWLGRRYAMAIGCLGVVIGTCITSTATTLPVFIGGRFLLSFFGTIASTAAPCYMIEISPSLYSGTVSGLYNTLFYFGSILASASVYGAHIHMGDSTQTDWRLPLWLQMACPCIVLVFIWFCPESPRWLIGVGRDAEARAMLVKYHANGDEHHPLVELTMKEMREAVVREGPLSWAKFFDWRPLFNTPGRRYRMMVGIAFAWFGQFSGQNIAVYYLPKLLQNIGVTDTTKQLEYNIVYNVLGYVVSTVGARFHDILGRRKMFLISCTGMIISLSIVAGTAADFLNTGSQSASKACIAFAYGLGCSYAWAFTSMHPIYPGEVMSNDMRAKGMCLCGIVAGAGSFVSVFAAPTAMNNIQYWFYAFFAFWDVFEWAFVYFFFVETKGRTLEELEEIFNSPNPAKASVRFVKIEVGETEKEKQVV